MFGEKKEEEEEAGRRRKKEEDIQKSNNPHLASGEKYLGCSFKLVRKNINEAE